MIRIVGILSNDARHHRRYDDDVIDRMSYRFTTFVLTLFAALVSTKQLVGMYHGATFIHMSIIIYMLLQKMHGACWCASQPFVILFTRSIVMMSRLSLTAAVMKHSARQCLF